MLHSRIFAGLWRNYYGLRTAMNHGRLNHRCGARSRATPTILPTEQAGSDGRRFKPCLVNRPRKGASREQNEEETVHGRQSYHESSTEKYTQIPLIWKGAPSDNTL